MAFFRSATCMRMMQRKAQNSRSERSSVASKIIAGVPVYNYHLSKAASLVQTDENLDWRKPSWAGGIEEDWIIVLRPGVTDAQLADFCQGMCQAFGHPSSGGVPFLDIHGTVDDLKEILTGHADQVDFVEPDLPIFQIPEDPTKLPDPLRKNRIFDDEEPLRHNRVFGPTIKSDPFYPASESWGLDRIGVPHQRLSGKGVHIYVVDTGVRSSHLDFGGRVVPTIDTIAGNGSVIECEGNPSCATDETSGHGTHCAGTAGGRRYGVAPRSTLHAVKACCGTGTNVLASLDWIATNAERPAVVTMSLGMQGKSMAAQVAVDAVVNAGISVVVASGNSDMDACNFTYAYIPSAISVAAANHTDTRASFSNWGTCNDLFAPGVSITSASNRSDYESRTISGTSMAAPHVAGAAALLLEHNPNLTPAEIKAMLLEMAAKNDLTDLMDGDANLMLSLTSFPRARRWHGGRPGKGGRPFVK